jgi:hypothetical protein
LHGHRTGQRRSTHCVARYGASLDALERLLPNPLLAAVSMAAALLAGFKDRQ